MPAQAKNQSSSLKTKIIPLKVMLEWQAPARPFRKKSKEAITTIGAILILIGIILIFLKEWFLIAVIIALAFFFYILSTVKPEIILHKITNKGITTGDKDYFYDQLIRFWFDKEVDQEILFIDGFERFNFRLMLLLNSKSKEQLKKILSEYLPEEKPEETWADRAGSWVSRQIPLGK